MTSRVLVTASTGIDPATPASRRETGILAQKILDALGMGETQVELHLVDDKRMAAIHREFMGRTGPTNVLSFPDEDPENPDFAGNVVLSIDTLLREADLYGQPALTHMTRLLAHAFLHLAGLDHGPEMDDLTETAVQTVTAI